MIPVVGQTSFHHSHDGWTQPEKYRHVIPPTCPKFSTAHTTRNFVEKITPRFQTPQPTEAANNLTNQHNRPANKMKFLKVGRVAIITRGRYAGKKVHNRLRSPYLFLLVPRRFDISRWRKRRGEVHTMEAYPSR